MKPMILALCLALLGGPYLHAEGLTPTAATAPAPEPTPAPTPQAAAVPTPAPTPAPASNGVLGLSADTWHQIGWTALIIGVVVAIAVILSNQPKGGSSSGSSGYSY